jgi:hypothetical protein
MFEIGRKHACLLMEKSKIGRKRACLLMEKSTRSRDVFLYIFISDHLPDKTDFANQNIKFFMSYDDRAWQT